MLSLYFSFCWLIALVCKIKVSTKYFVWDYKLQIDDLKFLVCKVVRKTTSTFATKRGFEVRAKKSDSLKAVKVDKVFQPLIR